MSHIGLVLPNLEAGGTERVILMLAGELAKRGHRVDLILFSASGALLRFVPREVRLVDLKAVAHGLGRVGFGLSAWWRLAAWLRREKPEALLSSITGANIVALLARSVLGAPMRLVIRVAGSVESVTSKPRFWLVRWLYPKADAVIALSSVMAEQLVDCIGVSASKVHYVPNPIDSSFIREQAKKPLRHPWIDDNQVCVVIAVGRLVPEKDYVTLLRAFAFFPKDWPIRLLVLGDGPERARLVRLAAELQIDERVGLIGFDPNPWRWMARANLFVLSSRSEGMPNSVLEARALGLPILLTEYDRSARHVGGDGALLVRAGDPEALADAISIALFRTTARPPPIALEPDPITAYEAILVSAKLE